MLRQRFALTFIALAAVAAPAWAQTALGNLPAASSPAVTDIIPCSKPGVIGSTKGCTPAQIVQAAGAEVSSRKGVANGYAGLDGTGKVPAAQSQVQTVAGRTGAISLSTGDVSGLGTAALQPSTAFDAAGAASAAQAAAVALAPGLAPVQTVAGRKGAVTLSHGDIADWATTLQPYALSGSLGSAALQPTTAFDAAGAAAAVTTTSIGAAAASSLAAETSRATAAEATAKPALGVGSPNAYGSMQAAANASVVVEAGPLNRSALGTPSGSRNWNYNDATQLRGSVQAAGQLIIDRGYGNDTEAVWDPGTGGDEAGLRMGFPRILQATRYLGANTDGDGMFFLNAVGGGVNTSTRGKSTYSSLLGELISPAAGQHLVAGVTSLCYGIGDCLGLNESIQSDGGSPASGDEGLSYGDKQLKGSFDVYGNTVSTGGTGATTLTLSSTPTMGAGTQGAGRFLYDTTQAEACGGTLKISTIAGSGPTTMTLSGTGCSVSTAETTSTAVATVALQAMTAMTSVNLAVSSSANFTIGGVVTVADPLAYETALITAIPDTTHLTLALHKQHNSGAIIAQGGAAGEVVVLTADIAPAGTYTYYTAANPVPQALPVIYSDATHLYVYVDITGAADAYSGRATIASGANVFGLYPAAEVLDTSNGLGITSNIFTLAPNVVAWTAGDAVVEPPYPFQKITGGNWGANWLFPTQTAAPFAVGYSLTGPMHGSDRGFFINSTTPYASYTQGGGALTMPAAGFDLIGYFAHGYRVQNWGPGGAFSANYDATVGATTRAVLEADNAGSPDFLSYNQSTKSWSLTVNSQGSSISFTSGSVSFPATATALSMNELNSGGTTTIQAAGSSGVITAAKFQVGVPNSGAYASVYPALTATAASFGGSSVAAGSCITEGTAVTGATTAMVAETSPVTYPGDGLEWSAYVSAAGTVTNRVCNRTSAAVTPTASAYNDRVIQ